MASVGRKKGKYCRHARKPHGKGFMTMLSKVDQASWMISYQFSSRIVTITNKNRVSMVDSMVLLNGVGDSSSSAPINGAAVVAVILRRDIAGSTKNCPMNIHGAVLGPLLSITRHSRVLTSTRCVSA